jgi:hypothetical protein
MNVKPNVSLPWPTLAAGLAKSDLQLFLVAHGSILDEFLGFVSLESIMP